MRFSAKAFSLCLIRSVVFCIMLYPLLRLLFSALLPDFVFLAAIITALLFLLLLARLIILYFCFRCELGENLLLVISGFFVKKEKRLLLLSAVGAKLLSTPLMRYLKLTYVFITFEGSVYMLPPVSADFAALIIDNIEKRYPREEI